MFRIDGELDKSITLAFAMQARQQSWADETGGAPGVLEFTSRSNVFPCMASHTMAHLNGRFSPYAFPSSHLSTSGLVKV